MPGKHFAWHGTSKYEGNELPTLHGAVENLGEVEIFIEAYCFAKFWVNLLMDTNSLASLCNFPEFLPKIDFIVWCNFKGFWLVVKEGYKL
jgi:hypothetical protein